MLQVGLVLTLGSGCDKNKDIPPVPKARSQAVVGKTRPTASASASVAVPPPVHRDLCGGRLSAAKDLPEGEFEQRSGSGSTDLPSGLAVTGKWTWVNFWAAWCVPCKAEIPMLVSWEERLEQSGVPFRLTFVSVDDDERQLERFLKGQTDKGLRATHWLKDPDDREDWLEKAGLGRDPDLPAHLLLDPQGKIRCAITGAVESSDYDQLKRLITE